MKKAPTAADREVGRKIRLHRRDRKLTQPQLAQELGITSHQLQKYEAGVNRIAVGKLVEIATVLRIEMSAFFDPISTVEPSNDNTQVSDQFAFTHEALLMSLAFMQITDPLLRNRLLELVQTVASAGAAAAEPLIPLPLRET